MLKRRQAGFTILELLTVLVIIGLLAMIAANRFWAVKGRAYKVTMRSDLKAVATEQERYLEKNFQYAASTAALGYIASSGVTITITHSDRGKSWAAIAEHVSVPAERCGYFAGPAPAGVAAPATEAGVVACD